MTTHRHTDISESKERKERKAQIDRFIQSNKPKAKTRHGKKQSNITDNESAKMQTSHGMIQGYNGMACVDAKRQVICAAHATGSGQEHSLFIPLLNETKENMRTIHLGSRYLKSKKVIADTGLYSEDNAKYLSKEKMDGYIPDQYYRQRDSRFATKDTHKPSMQALFRKEEYMYHSHEDVFVCPNGKILKHYCDQTFGNTKGRVYKALLSDCKKCSIRKSCVRSEKSRQRTLCVVEKYFNRNFSDEM